MDKQVQEQVQGSFTEANPGDWPIWLQPMTEAQRWHLRFLTAETGEALDEGLTRTEAAKRINELQAKTRRGKGKT